MSNLKSK